MNPFRFLAIFILLAACGPKPTVEEVEEERAATRPPIRVGLERDAVQISTVPESMLKDAADYAIATDFGHYLNREMLIRFLPQDTLIAALLAQDLDLVFSGRLEPGDDVQEQLIALPYLARTTEPDTDTDAESEEAEPLIWLRSGDDTLKDALMDFIRDYREYGGFERLLEKYREEAEPEGSFDLSDKENLQPLVDADEH